MHIKVVDAENTDRELGTLYMKTKPRTQYWEVAVMSRTDLRDWYVLDHPRSVYEEYQRVRFEVDYETKCNTTRVNSFETVTTRRETMVLKTSADLEDLMKLTDFRLQGDRVWRKWNVA